MTTDQQDQVQPAREVVVVFEEHILPLSIQLKDATVLLQQTLPSPLDVQGIGYSAQAMQTFLYLESQAWWWLLCLLFELLPSRRQDVFKQCQQQMQQTTGSIKKADKVWLDERTLDESIKEHLREAKVLLREEKCAMLDGTQFAQILEHLHMLILWFTPIEETLHPHAVVEDFYRKLLSLYFAG